MPPPPPQPGWLEDPNKLPSTDLHFLPDLRSRLKQSLETVVSNLTTAATDHKYSFEQWFFASGTMANFEKGNIIVLGLFTMLIAVGLILSAAVILLILLHKPPGKSSANSVLVHFYLAQFLFCVSMIARTAQLQLNPCSSGSNGNFAFYAETVSTPMSQLALCVLALERFVAVTGLGTGFLRKCMNGSFTIHTILISAWTVLSVIVMLLLVAVKMLAKVVKPLSSLTPKKSSSIECIQSSATNPIGLLKDVLIALFALGVVLPAAVNAISHTWLLSLGHNLALICGSKSSAANRRGSSSQTRLAVLLSLNHIALSFPHILMSLFVSTTGRAYTVHSVFMVLRSVEVLVSALLFLGHNQYFNGNQLRCSKKSATVQNSSNSRSIGDIESLINTINVGSNGMSAVGGFANSTTIAGSNNKHYLTRSLPQTSTDHHLQRFRRSSVVEETGFPVEYALDNFDGSDPAYISTESNFRSARPYFDRPTTQQQQQRRRRTPPRPPPAKSSHERIQMPRRPFGTALQPPPPTPVMSSSSSRTRAAILNRQPPPIPPRRTSDSRTSTLLRQTPGRSSQRRLPAHSSSKRSTHNRSASVGATQMAEYRFGRDDDDDDGGGGSGRRPRSQNRSLVSRGRPRQDWFQSTITNEEEV